MFLRLPSSCPYYHSTSQGRRYVVAVYFDWALQCIAAEGYHGRKRYGKLPRRKLWFEMPH